MMSFRIRHDGGRILEANNAFGVARVEWDKSGRMISESLILRNPMILTEDQQSLIDARKAICAACEHNQGLTLRTVKCRNCGCSGVSLLHGMCKLGKWDTP